MTKEKLALEIIERLKKEYPDAGCTLDYDQAWKLLVSVRLAAQCTDARVNIVVQGLFEKYPSIKILALAFLVLIGVVLVAESFDIHIDKAYIYTAMAFALVVQILNILDQRKEKNG